MTPTELWLPVGAAAFYIYDSLCLLWQNELIFVRAGTHWRVTGGSEFRLMGRRVHWPNPLQPQHLSFPVRWSSADPRTHTESGADITRLHAGLALLRVLVLALATLLLVALPAVSWTLGAGLVLLLIFAAYYALVLVALIVIWRLRAAFHYTGKAYAALCFDALACAPFAVNLIRKLGRHRGLAGNPLQFAAQNFDPATLTQMQAILDARTIEASAARTT